MSKINLSIFILIIICSNINSQSGYKTTNYYGVETFVMYVNYSDDAESLKDIFMDETDIKNQILYKTGLKENNPKLEDELKKNITIQINYHIGKNPYAEEQYFGNYELRVLRLLNIPNSNYLTFPHAEIFSESNSFVNNYPIKSAWKKEIKEIISSLIDKFALDFKSSY